MCCVISLTMELFQDLVRVGRSGSCLTSIYLLTFISFGFINGIELIKSQNSSTDNGFYEGEIEAKDLRTIGQNESLPLFRTLRSAKEFLPGCENGTLSLCEALIPSRSDNSHLMGIPSTGKAVDAACTTFNKGMECYSNWARRCLKEEQVQRMNMSILGAHEIYAFLCRDANFKRDFLTHGACYRKISQRWDECAKRFIGALKIFTKHEKLSEDICCLRFAFVECVMQTTRRNCEASATRFIQPLAETLLRSQLHGQSPAHCVTMKPAHCPGSANHRIPFTTLVQVQLFIAMFALRFMSL